MATMTLPMAAQPPSAAAAAQPPSAAAAAQPPSAAAAAQPPSAALAGESPSTAAAAQPTSAAPRSATAPRDQRERRERRAAIAQRLIDLAPRAVEAIDWDALDQAPDWLGLPEASLLILQARLGALLHLPAMRLWIDGPRLAATRALLGEAVLDELLSHAEPAPPLAATPTAPIESAAQVGPSLRAAGVSVLLAALPPGALRDALARGLAPVRPAPLSCQQADALIVRARRMGGPKRGSAA